MKKIIVVISAVIVLLFLLLTFFIIEYKNTKEKDVRAIYISYIELDTYIKDKKEVDSKNNIKMILDNAKKLGFNTVITHVRPFSDSIYKSDYYPISNCILNDKSEVPRYDVLNFFIDEAHKRDIRFEAWVNPFRISNQTNLDDIPIDSPYYKMDAKILSNGIYLNPASKEVRELIVNGIKEIVTNYNVDGIHFDDYFYPDKTIDLDTYNKENTSMSIEEYRLNNILSLIKDVYKEIKKINKKVVFGISPQGNIENDYNDCYLDVKEILSNKGYIDYIMPQIYYGFNNGVKPFKETVDMWNSLIKIKEIKLIPALAFYKNGTFDKYAKEGKNEWIENNDIIKRQIKYLKDQTYYKGFSLFSYDYIFNKDRYTNNTVDEINNMLKEL